MSSISIVPSMWEEPFGRTAMESAAYGNATIISNKGGLPETFKNVTKMGHNGTWTFTFSSPFYMWLLENLY